ncbi:hypothetical protein COW99_06120 [Candidatus Roizmanbacteria bacterium CG22_combo_CG10-13_8_21_14_all_38_20]|uniref:Uncharacterized protein n=1 Tax=Candidatus Roizmanbacteria bacterium CG22_combo_CG10-13_8_21_14_all_38_20 TaxID=1974862 RepID=A0A2H0BTR5_9BACT|nr:hypothetical protein [Candidatus Microgenomates bacterium]PIP61067.1 MAG: hypothetical protein COW99_06120 [Candidatus Roizmanbacteria bacterium CG22_combo_CG10-13_8_21_14_all_38_20]PJC30853.1 MAG: hypothetical protein CO050_04785 [Candidatus Roizmanbacteria bacterium CG_4_9_14_0_2_um_filter_38_17]
MSRKTRKEKIIAELHRELKKGTVSATSSLSISSHSVKKTVTKQIIPVSPKHVTSDLRKTAILCFLAIGLEISLYYYLR